MYSVSPRSENIHGTSMLPCLSVLISHKDNLAVLGKVLLKGVDNIACCDRGVVYRHLEEFCMPGTIWPNKTQYHMHRDQSRCAPGQWVTSLQCNNVSHWLSTYIHWTLYAAQPCHDRHPIVIFCFWIFWRKFYLLWQKFSSFNWKQILCQIFLLHWWNKKWYDWYLRIMICHVPVPCQLLNLFTT